MGSVPLFFLDDKGEFSWAAVTKEGREEGFQEFTAAKETAALKRCKKSRN